MFVLFFVNSTSKPYNHDDWNIHWSKKCIRFFMCTAKTNNYWIIFQQDVSGICRQCFKPQFLKVSLIWSRNCRLNLWLWKNKIRPIEKVLKNPIVSFPSSEAVRLPSSRSVHHLPFVSRWNMKRQKIPIIQVGNRQTIDCDTLFFVPGPEAHGGGGSGVDRSRDDIGRKFHFFRR